MVAWNYSFFRAWVFFSWCRFFSTLTGFALLLESGKRADSFSKHRKDSSNEASKDGRIAAHGFSFRELATATKNFNAANLIGEGGFGRVYKGRLESTGQARTVTFAAKNIRLLKHIFYSC